MLRDYTVEMTLAGRVVVHQTRLVLEEVSWAAIGGCEAAQLTATGSDEALWLWATRLLADVEIYAPDATLIWGGVLWGVTLRMPWGIFDYSLDGVANRVAVQYSYETGGGVGTRQETAWAEDAASISWYGTLTRLLSASGMTPDAADARRDRYLAQYAWPKAAQAPEGRQSPGSVTLTCLGHWARLQFGIYNDATTGIEDTADFAWRVATGAAPWLNADDSQVDTSGVETSRYRADSRTAQYEIEEAAAIGNAAGERVLVGVDARKRLTFAAAEDEVRYYWKDGKPHNTMLQPVSPWQVTPGKWAEQVDIVAPKLAGVIAPGKFFIERVTLSGDGAAVEPTDAQTLESLLLTGLSL